MSPLFCKYFKRVSQVIHFVEWGGYKVAPHKYKMTFWSSTSFLTDQTLHQFHDPNTELELYRFTRGFHRTFASDVACQQEHLPFCTPESVPFWDFHKHFPQTSLFSRLFTSTFQGTFSILLWTPSALGMSSLSDWQTTAYTWGCHYMYIFFLYIVFTS